MAAAASAKRLAVRDDPIAPRLVDAFMTNALSARVLERVQSPLDRRPVACSRQLPDQAILATSRARLEALAEVDLFAEALRQAESVQVLTG